MANQGLGLKEKLNDFVSFVIDWNADDSIVTLIIKVRVICGWRCDGGRRISNK